TRDAPLPAREATIELWTSPPGGASTTGGGTSRPAGDIHLSAMQENGEHHEARTGEEHDARTPRSVDVTPCTDADHPHGPGDQTPEIEHAHQHGPGPGS